MTYDPNRIFTDFASIFASLPDPHEGLHVGEVPPPDQRPEPCPLCGVVSAPFMLRPYGTTTYEAHNAPCGTPCIRGLCTLPLEQMHTAKGCPVCNPRK